MNRLCLLLAMAVATAVHAQAPGVLEVRVFGGVGEESCQAVWSDDAGVLVAGETTSPVLFQAGSDTQAGPVGRKGFVMALDTALDHLWSFTFPGDPAASTDTPSSIVVRDVVRASSDSSVAWVLYDAPRGGAWEGHLMGVHATDGVVAEFDLTAPGAAFTAALTPAGGSTFLVVGHTASMTAPAVPTGIQVGLWSGSADAAPGWALLNGTEGMEALDADWHADTLYIAVRRTGFPLAPHAILAVTVDNGNPIVSDVAAIEDPDIELHRLTASAEGVAWAGTLTSPDGTLNAVFGRLAAVPDPMETAEWGQEWVVETVSAADRPARDVLWTGDVVQCAARTTTKGEGGAGALVQTRFGPTGAWFGQYTFGAGGDEDVRDLALDPEGRLLVVGASDSWTDLTAGNGSPDAAVFRSSRTNFTLGFDTVLVDVAVPTESVFVGLHERAPHSRSTSGWWLQPGDHWPEPVGEEWLLLAPDGRLVLEGQGRRVPHVHGLHWLRTARDPGAAVVPVWVEE